MFKREKKIQGKSNHKTKKEARSFIQPKLSFGKSGDAYEVEADKMAAKVVHKATASKSVQKKEGDDEVQPKSLSAAVTPLVQRMEGGEDESVQQKIAEEPVQKMEEEEAVQSKSEEEAVQQKEDEEAVQSKEDEEAVQKMEEDEAVQSKNEEEIQTKEEEEIQSKKGTNNTVNHVGDFESKLRRGSGGQPLAPKVKAAMEAGFGSDFSHIKIHNDAVAAKMSASINAQAFTHGNDIYFNTGKYDPNSKKGKTLLAHELTHTIQQKGAKEKEIQRKPNSRVPSSEKKDKNTLDKYKTAFPHFYKYMNDHFGEYLTGSDKIKRAMLKNTVGVLTPEKIREITRFQEGNGPNIELVNFSNPDQNGLYNYQANTISLSGKLIEKYEEIRHGRRGRYTGWRHRHHAGGRAVAGAGKCGQQQRL